MLFAAVLLCWGRQVAAVMSPAGPDLADSEEAFGACYRGGGALLPCATGSAVSFLESAHQREELELADGVVLCEESALAPRTQLPLDRNPTDARFLMTSILSLLERRSMRWDLGFLYPGLALRVGPSAVGTPHLEFVLDHKRVVDERHMGTGRLIVKRALLPLLLGIKVSAVSLIPLIFGALIVLTKKAFLISKYAFLYTTLLGFNTYRLQNQQGHDHNHYDHNHYDPVRPDDLPYKTNKLFQDVSPPFVTRTNRNFVWHERDKKSL